MFAAFVTEPFWFQAFTVAALAAVAVVFVLFLATLPAWFAECRTWLPDDDAPAAHRHEAMLRQVRPVDPTAEAMVRDCFARTRALHAPTAKARVH